MTENGTEFVPAVVAARRIRDFEIHYVPADLRLEYLSFHPHRDARSHLAASVDEPAGLEVV